jgi:hypothetical protein
MAAKAVAQVAQADPVPVSDGQRRAPETAGQDGIRSDTEKRVPASDASQVFVKLRRNGQIVAIVHNGGLVQTFIPGAYSAIEPAPDGPVGPTPGDGPIDVAGRTLALAVTLHAEIKIAETARAEGFESELKLARRNPSLAVIVLRKMAEAARQRLSAGPPGAQQLDILI